MAWERELPARRPVISSTPILAWIAHLRAEQAAIMGQHDADRVPNA
jgi:hypothetical protein